MGWSESGAGSASASASSAKTASEASSTEATETASTSEDDGTSPTATVSAVIILSVTFVSLDDVPAVLADVGYFFCPYTVVKGDGLTADALQLVFLAVRTTGNAAGGFCAEDDDKEEEQEEDYEVGAYSAAFVLGCVILH